MPIVGPLKTSEVGTAYWTRCDAAHTHAPDPFRAEKIVKTLGPTQRTPSVLPRL